MMPARDIPTRTQIALLIAFAANGLRGIERHARNHILEHIGLPVPASDERRVSAIFDDITPRPKAGRVRLDRCGDNVASAIVGPSDRIQLAMLAYLTRGGTLLGPGGLVRAYTAATQGAVEEAQEQGHIKIMTLVTKVTCVIPYSAYGRVERLVSDCAGRIADSIFAEDVQLTCVFKSGDEQRFVAAMVELMSGEDVCRVGEPSFSEF